jgi:hypothetical protein
MFELAPYKSYRKAGRRQRRTDAVHPLVIRKIIRYGKKNVLQIFWYDGDWTAL